MATLSTHVLDTSTGRPAAGVTVTLETVAGQQIGAEVTDVDGRVSRLGPAVLATGHYRLRLASGPYFERRGVDAFYPEVVVVFAVDEAEQHYHVPLLLSPFGFATYRGS